MDKTFGDCSIPQEKSNADINEELELSEASCEEDNTRSNSSQSGQKQPGTWFDLLTILELPTLY